MEADEIMNGDKTLADLIKDMKANKGWGNLYSYPQPVVVAALKAKLIGVAAHPEGLYGHNIRLTAQGRKHQ